MKKLIFSAAVLASAFFAASCQQEMLDPQAEGTTMTYTVEVPDAIATKAIGDVFTLHYEVYRQGDLSNLDADPIYEGTKEFSGVKADVQLEFVKDQEFKVLFWAQKGTPQAYDITDLREVSLGTLVANDTTAEVFAGNDHVVDCKSDKDGNVVLVRPVAQLNIATTAESFTLGTTGSTEATVVPTQSKVVVNGLYGTYNVADGTVGTKASRTYTEADVPGSDFKNTYKLMATNYLGFIPQAGDNVEVKFTIYTEKDGNIEHTVSNVPVKANYQTNIIGNLISATADYQVTLEDWADAGKDMEVLADGVVKNINGDYEISTAKGLAYAISNVFANGGTFYVLENIDMTGVSYDPADVPAGTTVHIVGETPVVTRSTGFVEITGLTKPLLKTVQNGAAASFANIYIDAPIDFVQTNNGVVAFNNCDNTATDSEDDLVGDNTNGTIAEEGTDINNLALEEALAAKASSIKLAGDITASEIIVVDYPVTIDGCGHKLTSSAGRAINVSGADGVTIKNLVIECTGERAINVINNATNVTIDNVTATAANYTVNVALSAPGAVVKIENCTLNGLNTVNVASPGAKVSVDNSTINCNDNNTTAGEAYSALCLNKAAVGAKIIATNTVVNVTDGSDSSKGRNGAEDGTVTINGSTEDVTVTIAVITYPGSDNYYGFETVASAIKFAKETDVISLIRNISVEETIVVNADKTVTIDLNGKTLNTVFADGSTTNHIYAFTNNGTLTLKNGTINTRGIFNYGTMTLESGTINAIDGNGGFGVRNYPGAEFVMNGGTIATTYEDGDVPGNGYDASPIRVDEGAKAVIKGGSINNISNYTCAIDNYGETIVDAGTFTSVHTTVANHASMTINGGSFTINNGLEGVTAHALWADAGTTTINGGTFDGKDNYNGFNVDASKGAVVNITGGKFLPVHSGSLYGEGTINVTGGEFFDNPSARVAEGYKAVQKADGKWEVVAKTYVAQDGDKKKYESLQEAFNAGGEITLLCDVTISETATLADDKTAVLDLNGKTITGTMHKSVGAVVKNNGALTIKNGTISSTAANGGSAVANNGTLIVEKATLNGAGHADGQWPSYTVNNTGVMTATETKITSYHGALASYGEGAEATLNKSEIDMVGIPGFTSHGIYTYNGGKVVVNGGTYENKATDQASSGASVINGAVEVNAGTFAGRIENYYGTPVLKGGTYSVDPTRFVATGYKAEQDSEGWSVVQE